MAAAPKTAASGSRRPRGRPRGNISRLRPFYGTLLIITCLTAFSFLTHQTASWPAISALDRRATSPLGARNLAVPLGECRDVHRAVDQCAFVRLNCEDDEAGLVSYLTLYFCTFGHARVFGFVLLAAWLGLLFTTIGIAASDFFSVNLSTIARILGLSESLAGVTFLAFGNGSPDVFSTFAAMGSNSASMAVGELVGAAGFITAVVAGSMALVREFKVAKRTYVRDICFFVVAVIFTVAFLADGHLHLWECIAMIAYYIFYVIVVVGWHWFDTRQRRMRARAAAARGHVYGSTASDELAYTPYHDDPDDDDEDDGQVGSRGSYTDISVLEAGGPRIEIDGEEAQLEDKAPEEDEDKVERQVAAEMTSSMRVTRPRGRRSTTITPIRPSLVGALEFRSALAQLQKESNLKLRSMPSPEHGRGRGHVRAYSEFRITGLHGNDSASEVGVEAPGQSLSVPPGRHRALSANDVPPSFSLLPPPAHEQTLAGPSGTSTTRSLSPVYQIGGNLAPPPIVVPQATPRASAQNLPQLVIPTGGGAGSDQSSPASPFPVLPAFTDSPLLLTPNPRPEQSDFFFSPTAPVRLETPLLTPSIPEVKPVRWWPYSVLPPPHILQATLFPTLQGWSDKSGWDKILSAVSLPSILLLVITLPIVDTESPDDDSVPDLAPEVPFPGVLPGAPLPGSSEPGATPMSTESEWQRYRRSTRSRSSTGRSSGYPSPLLSPADVPTIATPRLIPPTPVATDHGQAKNGGPLHDMLSSVSDMATGDDSDEASGWNRWLVSLQLFTGPLFAMLVLWANMREDLENPGRTLVRMMLYTLLCSCALLAVLLATTTPDRRPQYHFLLCFLGFVISVAWISTIAGEVVGVLKAFGVILGISEALLGLTVFAAGNSVGDLVADVTIARLGYPVMALSACFGGPMLNILLGIGLGGAYMMVQAANQRQKKHPDRPYHYKPYKIQIDGSLLISTIVLLITLLFLLVMVPWNKWVLSRRIGYGLISLWTIGTIVNVIIEVTGVWSEMIL
ncbi:sodium/calcium exchanger protein [Plectosphaerella plurivora]|uniref:Sodium/calcium exchanger protein n=1 Tax=Plectosphaerella plurivora TaxID=936078 RepID=A0A9P8VHL4_9PEZI|nr:sodium/calcium exchanger protein [Plectosphaerella plurivora]